MRVLAVLGVAPVVHIAADDVAATILLGARGALELHGDLLVGGIAPGLGRMAVIRAGPNRRVVFLRRAALEVEHHRLVGRVLQPRHVVARSVVRAGGSQYHTSHAAALEVQCRPLIHSSLTALGMSRLHQQ